MTNPPRWLPPESCVEYFPTLTRDLLDQYRRLEYVRSKAGVCSTVDIARVICDIADGKVPCCTHGPFVGTET